MKYGDPKNGFAGIVIYLLKRICLIHFAVLIFLLILHRIKVFKALTLAKNEKGIR